jgi:hypothetical protein
MSISAMKQALEALDSDNPDIQLRAATALRTAIEQAEDAVAAEREACAKVCDEKVDAEYKTGKVDHNEMAWTQACASAIRARGEQ